MVRLVLGPSGSGKTKWLIDKANEDKKSGNGNIVFIDTDDSHIFSLDHGVRLINAADYGITDSKRFYGFIAGIISRDYDIEKVYIDGIYSIINFNLDTFIILMDSLEELSKNFNVEFYMGMDHTLDELPEKYRADAEELKL